VVPGNQTLKKYNGPDEDGKYLFKSEHNKQQRMVEHGNRLSGGGGGELKAIEEGRKKYAAFEKAEECKLVERSLLDLRKFFKQYDGVDNLLIEVNRRKKCVGDIFIDINNDNLTKNKKLSSVITIGVGKWSEVEVHVIEPNAHFLIEARRIYSRPWGHSHQMVDPWYFDESEWPKYFKESYAVKETKYHSLRIYRRDEVRASVMEESEALKEIEFSKYEIPEKKKRGKK
jgi:hypothetical protein